MQSDKDGSALGICRFRTIVGRRTVIGLAREDHAQALRFERDAQQSRKAQHHVTLRNARGSMCAGIGAAVGWVENDDSQVAHRRGGLHRRLAVLWRSLRWRLRSDLSSRRARRRLRGLRTRREYLRGSDEERE